VRSRAPAMLGGMQAVLSMLMQGCRHR
jgi:hypothetical protein